MDLCTLVTALPAAPPPPPPAPPIHLRLHQLAGAAGGAGGAGGGGGGAAGNAVTSVQNSIFRGTYTEIECVQSVVELREDLIPTTDFPAVVEEVKSQHNLTILNVWNVPDYKAMLLTEGDEQKLVGYDRFLPAETTCGEIILEAVLPANIQEVSAGCNLTIPC